MSSVEAWCYSTCEQQRTGQVVERGVEPPDYMSKEGGSIVRAACSECGGDLFARDPDQIVTWMFEVRPEKHAMAEETSSFIAAGKRGELDALEHDLGQGNWVSAWPSSPSSPAEVRSEYDYLFDRNGNGEDDEEES